MKPVVLLCIDSLCAVVVGRTSALSYSAKELPGADGHQTKREPKQSRASSPWQPIASSPDDAALVSSALPCRSIDLRRRARRGRLLQWAEAGDGGIALEFEKAEAHKVVLIRGRRLCGDDGGGNGTEFRGRRSCMDVQRHAYGGYGEHQGPEANLAVVWHGVLLHRRSTMCHKN